MNKYKLLVTMFTAALLTANSSITLAGGANGSTVGKCYYSDTSLDIVRSHTATMKKKQCDKKPNGSFLQD